ncbi:MAG: C39 family peptidase, partial [Fluviibacter sp.]
QVILATLLASLSTTASAKPYMSLQESRSRGVVLQKWETSCAAAALATVLTYGFRDPVDERSIAAKMLAKTDPAKVKAQGGFSLLDLKKYVMDRGYQGGAYKDLSFDDLRYFHAPIVPLDLHGYHHYVVVNGVEGNRVLLADPAFGNRTISIEKFKRVWMNGLAFVITRTEEK